MSVQVSCPVFRCPQTSVGKCSGYRRNCERYYCRTHSKGTLCDRCTGIKQEEMKSGYRQMIKSLERKAYTSSMTAGVVALFLISLLLLGVAVVYGLYQRNNQSNILIFIFSLGGGFAGLFGALLWWVMKARELMRAESVELDMKYPGFYDYYRQWQAKIDEITT